MPAPSVSAGSALPAADGNVNIADGGRPEGFAVGDREPPQGFVGHPRKREDDWGLAVACVVRMIRSDHGRVESGIEGDLVP